MTSHEHSAPFVFRAGEYVQIQGEYVTCTDTGKHVASWIETVKFGPNEPPEGTLIDLVINE
jgi:hypothetical protein